MKTENNRKSKSHIIRSLIFSMSILLSSSLFLCACKKLVEVPKSSNLVLREDIFSNDEIATSALMGLYNKMVTLNLSVTNGGLSVYSALSADELYGPTADMGYDLFSVNNIPSANGIINNNFWSTSYKNIYHANSILEGLDASNTLSNGIKRQLRGETLVIRALYFFYLTNLFGDVPLVLSTNFEQNSVMARTAAKSIMEQLIEDLKEATELLPFAYANTARARVNSFTARAFLSRVYLYNREWNNAEVEATTVISSGLYSLESDLNKTFISTSNETIWQLVRETSNTAEAAVLIPVSTTAVPSLVIRKEFLKSFEPGDQRKISWIKSNTVNGQQYDYPYKYKIRTNSIVGEYLIVFRLAEQYLIRAEARAEQGNLRGAIEDLNVLRARSRALATPEIPNPLPDITSDLGNSGLLGAVYKERFNEFFCEWGHRWLDLKRSGTADRILLEVKPSWKTYAQFYPIPFDETQLNIYLTQNPGYAD